MNAFIFLLIIASIFCIFIAYKKNEEDKRKTQIKNLVVLLEKEKDVQVEKFRQQHEERISNIVNEFNKSLNELYSHYVGHSEKTNFIETWKRNYLEIKSLNIPKEIKIYNIAKRFISDYETLDEWIDLSNEEFMIKEKDRCRDLLSNIDDKSLDDQQRDVVVADEDHCLVLAGAGSGKTLTISGKVKYLCDERDIDPCEILLLSFNASAATEMKTRIEGKLGIEVESRTFHSLGLQIIKNATNSEPKIEENSSKIIKEYFKENIFNDFKIVEDIVKYFAYYVNLLVEPSECSSTEELAERNKVQEFETLKSQYTKSEYVIKKSKENKIKMKSIAEEKMRNEKEIIIANFLFLNGIEYEYEREYLYDPLYKPSFYLVDYDIYLEYFDKEDSAQEKRKIHSANKTQLLEIFANDFINETIDDRLKHLLKENDIETKPMDYKEIFEAIYGKNPTDYYANFINLCSNFICLFKSNGFTLENFRDMEQEANNTKDEFLKQRDLLFLHIAKAAFMHYEEHLRKENKIDFSDMINKAADLVDKGIPHKYKYVIVDEYQDTSVARYKLVKSILDYTGAKLLCVGDDWQSIYRFAGSDLTLFTSFEEKFGYTREMRIEKTYRNSQELIDVMRGFVMKNKLQKDKNLKSDKRINQPIEVWFYDENELDIVLEKIMESIISEFGTGKSITFLGRVFKDRNLLKKNKDFTIRSKKKSTPTTEGWESDDDREAEVSYKKHPMIKMDFLTVHRSKGLEADNIILLNFRDAMTGFPIKIKDDPVLRFVLGNEDDYPYAEERRLFYVATTRTKNKVYILTHRSNPSPFLKEIQDNASVRIVNKNSEKMIKCPACKIGILKMKGASGKEFVGCSSYPKCTFTTKYVSILNTNKRCPKCGYFMVERNNMETGKPFWGCINYSQKGDKRCTYTEPIRE